MSLRLTMFIFGAIVLVGVFALLQVYSRVAQGYLAQMGQENPPFALLSIPWLQTHFLPNLQLTNGLGHAILEELDLG